MTIHKILAISIGIALALLAPADAQYVPQGSYLQSCANVRMGGAQLFAVCPAPSGQRIASSIDVNACSGADIANINGYLRCKGNPTPGYGQQLPTGSYQASCVNTSIRGSLLSASCSSPNGQRPFSQLDIARCGGTDIQNSNGYLACGAGGAYNGNIPNGGAAGGGLPNGSYQMSCTNASMTYGRLTATCPASNGARQTSSINLGRCRPGTDIANINGYLECLTYR